MVPVEGKNQEWLKKLFYNWYKSKWKPWSPKESRWHQFKFHLFSGKWAIPIDKRIRSANILRKNLLKFKDDPVKDVFHSVLKWLGPKDLGGKGGEINVCLGGPLVFDLDIGNFSLSTYQEALNKLFEEVRRLSRYLHESYGFSDFAEVFSGKKGFHLYVKDFELDSFTNIDPVHREEQETAVRAMILNDVLKQGFNVDKRVTADTRRVIRLPGTLHGSTTFLCSFIKDQKKFSLQNYLAFGFDQEVRIRLNDDIESFPFGDEVYGPYKKGLIVETPLAVAAFLVSINVAAFRHQ